MAQPPVSYLLTTSCFSAGYARSIRKLFCDWGIHPDFHTTGEEKLLDIKSYRNALAHGERAFKEVGRNYTMRDMNEYNQVLYAYLSDLLLNVRYFLDNKKYLRKATNL